MSFDRCYWNPGTWGELDVLLSVLALTLSSVYVSEIGLPSFLTAMLRPSEAIASSFSGV